MSDTEPKPPAPFTAVFIFPNGMVAVTDGHKQVPEFQGRYEEAWPKISRYDLSKVEILR